MPHYFCTDLQKEHFKCTFLTKYDLLVSKLKHNIKKLLSLVFLS